MSLFSKHRTSFVYICIGLINGLIFGLLTVILIHYFLLFLQNEKMIYNYLKPLAMFKDYMRSLPPPVQTNLKTQLKTTINEQFDNPEIKEVLMKEKEEYMKKFTLFITLLGVLGGISIFVLSFLIIKFNKNRYRMGHLITLKVTDKNTVFLEWFLEILVTLFLVFFIYIYFNHIISRYIYANVMEIFTLKEKPRITEQPRPNNPEPPFRR